MCRWYDTDLVDPLAFKLCIGVWPQIRTRLLKKPAIDFITLAGSRLRRCYSASMSSRDSCSFSVGMENPFEWLSQR